MGLLPDEERELIEKAKRGRLAVLNNLEDSEDVIEEGRKAFDELWRAYEVSVKGVINSWLLSPVQRNNDLDDLVNKTAWEVFERIHTYDPDISKFYTWVRIWAKYVLLRYFREQNRRLEVEMLKSELKVAANEVEQDVEESIKPAVVVYEDTSDELEDRLAEFENLLRITFDQGGYPHQLIAFGFIKLLEWKPSEIVDELKGITLRELARKLEDDYVSTLEYESKIVRNCFKPLHQKMESSLKEVIPSEDSRRIVTASPKEKVGNTKLPDYWGAKPEANLANWCYKVRQRVIRIMVKQGIDC